MAKLDDRSTRRDRFHQKAKREGFAARAVYKLEEIDQRHTIFERGITRVLDLGCAPGSWLQYARQRIGDLSRTDRFRSAAKQGSERPHGEGPPPEDSAQLVGLDRGPLQRPP